MDSLLIKRTLFSTHIIIIVTTVDITNSDKC